MFKPIGRPGDERVGYLSRPAGLYEAMGLPYWELRGRRVLLLGAGLIGSHVALLLSRLPVELTLVDDGRVGWENIAYQLLPARSIGEPKTGALARLLRELGHPADVEPLVASLPSICSIARGEAAGGLGFFARLAARHDVLVDALDDPRYRQTAWLLAWATGKPIVSAAYWGKHGVVAASPDPRRQSLWCLWSRIAGPERVNYHADPLLVAAAAALAAETVYSLLAGLLDEPLQAILRPGRLLYRVEQGRPVKCMDITADSAEEAAREMLRRSVVETPC